MVMGVVRRKEGTKLVDGLYGLEVVVMRLRCLEVLLPERNATSVNE